MFIANEPTTSSVGLNTRFEMFFLQSFSFQKGQNMTLKDSEYQKSGYPASLHFCKWRICSLKVQYSSVVRRFSLKISDIFFLMFLSSRRKIRAAKWIALSDSGLAFLLLFAFLLRKKASDFRSRGINNCKQNKLRFSKAKLCFRKD